MPGMMQIENVQVQLIDTPPFSDDYIDPEFLNLIRRVDLALIMLDLHTDPVTVGSVLARLRTRSNHRRLG